MGIIDSVLRLLGFGSNENEEYQKSERDNGSRVPETSRQEVKNLKRKIASGEYIQNLRIGRSWILPQMVQMCFDADGKFSSELYYNNISDLDYENCWTIFLRNYKALADIHSKDPKGYGERAKWWTKDVALALVRYDLQELKECDIEPETNCKGGPYIYYKGLRGTESRYDKMFFLKTPPAGYVNAYKEENETVSDLYAAFEKRIQAVEAADTPKDLYEAVKQYDRARCTGITMECSSVPEAYVEAYAGDGAYSAMMTMVKHLNLTFDGMNRDECIAAIENKSSEVGHDGRKLFAYCAQKFFDKQAGGVFDLGSYNK